MRKNRLMILAVLLLSMVLLLTACGGSKATIVGKWTSPALQENAAAQLFEGMGVKIGNIEYEFTADGKMNTLMDGQPMMEALTKGLQENSDLPDEIKASLGAQADMDVTYKLEGEKLTVTTKYQGVETTAGGTAKLNGDKLSLTVEGQPAMELTRVK